MSAKKNKNDDIKNILNDKNNEYINNEKNYYIFEPILNKSKEKIRSGQNIKEIE